MTYTKGAGCEGGGEFGFATTPPPPPTAWEAADADDAADVAAESAGVGVPAPAAGVPAGMRA